MQNGQSENDDSDNWRSIYHSTMKEVYFPYPSYHTTIWRVRSSDPIKHLHAVNQSDTKDIVVTDSSPVVMIAGVANHPDR